jgi:succinoglycan biosynthesis transport protein ExoP
MSQLVPYNQAGPHTLAQPAPPMPSWGARGEDEGDDTPIAERLTRYWHAIVRYRWLVAACVVVLGGLGVLAGRFVKPEYSVRATIWIAGAETEGGQRRGPIRADELLRESAWVELFQSFAIVDAVVRETRLFVTPANKADSAAFSTFSVDERLLPGNYVLKIAADGVGYALLTGDNRVVERGALTDSVGRPIGFRWLVPSGTLRPGQSVSFRVISPRERSILLLQDVEVNLPRNSNFMRVSLRGTNQNALAGVMNTWISQFVAVSANLKKRNLVEFARILQGQLSYAERQLKGAEYALQSFRINTITLPSEGAPIAAGLEMTRDPVFSNFFEQKVDYDNVRRDREALERIVAAGQGGTLSPESIYSIPGLLTGPSGEQLRGAVTELGAKQAQLTALRQTYTDEYRPVRDLTEQIRVIRAETIPGIARTMLAQLRTRETDLGERIAGASREMRDIPTRTIEEMRLRREVTVAENLYTSLQNRYEEAKLAEASAVPDVSILDSAVTPQEPSSNRAPILIAIGLAAGLGAGVLLALLLDHLDPRFRYVRQATSELGLHVIGAVPTIRRGRGAMVDVEEAAQVVESFRSIRLSIRHAFDAGGPILFTVTSPGVHDGKSLVSSNLALAFAESGYRTVLVDGDTRRGEQHAMLGVEQRPGLLEFLAGEAGLDDVIKRTAHDKLSLVPCGARRHHAPELIASPVMTALVGELTGRYDVIVVDSPPLSAGIDPYALGTATGNVLLVLRAGETDRKLAQAKLRTVANLPLRMLGAVLNDVRTTEGEFRYYAYDYSSATAADADRATRSTVGEIGTTEPLVRG